MGNKPVLIATITGVTIGQFKKKKILNCRELASSSLMAQT